VTATPADILALPATGDALTGDVSASQRDPKELNHPEATTNYDCATAIFST
jgi:hypothetical protein